MLKERRVRLFRNGRNQAVRIPREFELEGNTALIYKEGEKLIIKPLKTQGLLACLEQLEPLEEDFPDLDQGLLSLDDVKL